MKIYHCAMATGCCYWSLSSLTYQNWVPCQLVTSVVNMKWLTYLPLLSKNQQVESTTRHLYTHPWWIMLTYVYWSQFKIGVSYWACKSNSGMGEPGHSTTRRLISSQIFRCIWEFLTVITFFTHFYTSFNSKKIGVHFSVV